MNFLKNFLKYIAFICFIFLLVGAVLVYFKSDSILKHNIEQSGTTIFNTPVTIEKVNLRFFEGELKLIGLRVKNFEGFEQPYLLEASEIKIKLSILDILKNQITISDISAEAPNLYLDRNDKTDNFTYLLKDMKKRKKLQEHNDYTAPVEISRKNPFIIKNININNMKLHVRSGTILEATGEIEKIHLKEIGSRDDISMQEVMIDLVEQLYTSGIAGNMGKVSINLKKTLNNIKGEVQKSVEGLSDSFNQMIE